MMLGGGPPKATVEDIIRQVFLVEERNVGSQDIFDAFPKLELKAIKQRKVPMIVIHQDGDSEDIALIPLKALTAMLRHSVIVMLAKQLAKQDGKAGEKGKGVM